MTLWYDAPADRWVEALPLGNGRLGAMVFGRVAEERIALNEESLWAGRPVDTVSPEARAHLKELQRLLLHEKHQQAYALAMEYFTQRPSSFRSYQPLGDLMIHFDTHPPFQIDGNFGGTAGIAKMLVQSHRGTPGARWIDVLPALPTAWADGHVRGLRARGDFTIAIAWSEGRAETVRVTSGSGNVCRMRYEGLDDATVHTAQGDPVAVERPAFGQLVFDTEAGVTYVIDVSA